MNLCCVKDFNSLLCKLDCNFLERGESFILMIGSVNLEARVTGWRKQVISRPLSAQVLSWLPFLPGPDRPSVTLLTPPPADRHILVLGPLSELLPLGTSSPRHPAGQLACLLQVSTQMLVLSEALPDFPVNAD